MSYDTYTAPELTDAQYEISDRVGLFLHGKGDRDYTASQLARAAGCSTTEVYPVLRWLIGTHMIGVAGRGGCWIRYREHRHGEVNR